ncbi:unnamed protein product [Parnassius apollo]|uniref:(apollo) hypothetical protein n=1 Tax=Parnassius apollo TaxID=110799 RepID=A0A8S3Y6S1_PARAO|nr:unnamed protein product [Parnassius apollo]
MAFAGTNISLSQPDITRKLTERIDDLKQKIAAWGKRIRRFTERSRRFNQNRLFQSDQKRLYKSLERPVVCGAGPGPDQANTVAFWRGLWSEPVNHSEGPWTEVVASQCASITPMDPVIITPDDVAEAVRRAPNWKSPGLDGLHHYWLKGFMVCHAVLARQFQEALNQKSLPSLFTTGITHLVPKDQVTTDPSKYRPITAKGEETGCLAYRARMHRLFAELEPSLTVTEQNPADRVRYILRSNIFDVAELERLRREAVPSSDENATAEDAVPQMVDAAVNTPVVVDSNDDGTVAQELELEHMRSTLEEAIVETRSAKVSTAGRATGHSSAIPAWRRRIEERIAKARALIGRLICFRSGNNRPRIVRTVRMAFAGTNISLSQPDITQKLTERIDDLKQRIAAWGKRIRRYTERSTRFNQNRLYQSDQKRLYESLERPMISGTGPAPNQADTEAFWRGLWSEPVNHSEGPWTEVVASQCAGITPMDPVIITPDDVAEAVRRAPNWKSPGLDGLHHYRLKGMRAASRARGVARPPSSPPHPSSPPEGLVSAGSSRTQQAAPAADGARRMRWSKSMNENALRAYFRAKWEETGCFAYRAWMHRFFAELEPSLSVTEQNLADRVRYILRSNIFGDAELERLRREAIPSSNGNATAGNAAPLDAQQTAYVDAAINIPFVANSDDDGIVSHELEKMRSILEESMLETRSMPLENRPRLPRIPLSKRNRAVVRALNPMLVTYLEASRDLCETDSILFGAALAVCRIIGAKLPVAGRATQKSSAIPAWRKRIEDRIAKARALIGRLTSFRSGNNRPRVMRTVRMAFAGTNISLFQPDITQKLTERIDDLKQKIAAWGKRIRRFSESSRRFNQNRLYQSDQKRLYKSLERPEVCGAGPGPDQADTVAFWRGLWSEPVNHSEGPWMEVVASQSASVTPMDPVTITPEDLAEAVRIAPNWKSSELDGLHHYWLKGFVVCHAVLARQFQEALDQKSPSSLFNTGITHLVPKDQDTTDPSKYCSITPMVKSYKFVKCRPVYENLMSELRAMWPQNVDTEEEYDVIHTAFAELKLIGKGYYYSHAGLIIFFDVPPIISCIRRAFGENIPQNLIFPYWFPFDPHQRGLFEFLFMTQIWHSFITMCILLAADLFFYTFLSHIASQLHLLAIRIKKMFHVPIDDQLIQEYPLGKCNKICEENMESVSENEWEIFYQKKLVEVISRHRALIR